LTCEETDAMSRWTAADLPDQTGRTVIVTGANSGLGLETSRALAAAGARVIMTARDPERGRRAVAEVDGRAELAQLDLSDLASVRDFATSWSDRVDVLINNAGVMALPDREVTVDGFERQFGTNHLGPFALTNLLLPKITDRVVTVSSSGHRMGGLDLGDLNWQRRRYAPWRAYGQTKLANLLFTLELQRRLDAERSPLRAVAAHPGLSATNLFRPKNRVTERLGRPVIALFGQSAEMGALPQLFAATVEIPGGSYVGPDGVREAKGYPTLVGRSSDASDLGLAARLWAASEDLTGVSFPTGSAGRGPS
jgi:NAD(P)-dependent dehydrogenase (short-subunit alcohol dehydrogenase family)